MDDRANMCSTSMMAASLVAPQTATFGIKSEAPQEATFVVPGKAKSEAPQETTPNSFQSMDDSASECSTVMTAATIDPVAYWQQHAAVRLTQQHWANETDDTDSAESCRNKGCGSWGASGTTAHGAAHGAACGAAYAGWGGVAPTAPTTHGNSTGWGSPAAPTVMPGSEDTATRLALAAPKAAAATRAPSPVSWEDVHANMRPTRVAGQLPNQPQAWSTATNEDVSVVSTAWSDAKSDLSNQWGDSAFWQRSSSRSNASKSGANNAAGGREVAEWEDAAARSSRGSGWTSGKYVPPSKPVGGRGQGDALGGGTRGGAERSAEAGAYTWESSGGRMSAAGGDGGGTTWERSQGGRSAIGGGGGGKTTWERSIGGTSAAGGGGTTCRRSNGMSAGSAGGAGVGASTWESSSGGFSPAAGDSFGATVAAGGTGSADSWRVGATNGGLGKRGRRRLPNSIGTNELEWRSKESDSPTHSNTSSQSATAANERAQGAGRGPLGTDRGGGWGMDMGEATGAFVHGEFESLPRGGQGLLGGDAGDAIGGWRLGKDMGGSARGSLGKVVGKDMGGVAAGGGLNVVAVKLRPTIGAALYVSNAGAVERARAAVALALVGVRGAAGGGFSTCGHRGISALVFDATPDGFQEAQRLTLQFEREGRGRLGFARKLVPLVDQSGKKNLFGYFATQQDVTDFNRFGKGKGPLKVDVKRRWEVVDEPLQRMKQQAAHAELYKSQVVEMSHKMVKLRIKSSQLQESRQQLESALEAEKQQRLQLEGQVVSTEQLMHIKEAEMQAIVARNKQLAAQHEEEVASLEEAFARNAEEAKRRCRAGVAQLKEQQQQEVRLLPCRGGVKQAGLESESMDEPVRLVDVCEGPQEESGAALDRVECCGMVKVGRRVGGGGGDGDGSEVGRGEGVESEVVGKERAGSEVVGGEWSGSDTGRREKVGTEFGRWKVRSVVEGGEEARSIEEEGVVVGGEGGKQAEGVREEDMRKIEKQVLSVCGEQGEKELCGAV
ncbi:unnamed protein product [Closterium sp. Yama58-4]|nr:unnamed protein product [Closterium sp. Yama58-4]